MTAEFKDHFSAHARDYREFRPDYPPELFEFLASIALATGLAWDCGTGNGQAAVALANHFDRVVATDASAEQIAQAAPHLRVEYAVAPAERSPLPDSSSDLITVTQALHWFDLDRFYAEVCRVARPGGLLAATCYYEPSVGPEVDPVLRRWEDFIRPYWTPERVWVDAGYRTIPFPFPELETPRLVVSIDATLPRFIGYLGTWSSTKAYIKRHSSNPVERFESEFAWAWGEPTRVRTVTWQFNVRLGRV
jgi:SAM-dependent methyltransferase